MAIEFFSDSNSAGNWGVFLRFEEIIKHDENVVVFISASWSGHCKKSRPIVEQCAEKYPDVTFVEVDYDSCKDIVEYCEDLTPPGYVTYHSGTRVIMFDGAVFTLPKLEKAIRMTIS